MSRDASPLRDRVAFLVGVRRSGTNWLRRIVDAHPDAGVIPGETCLLSHGIAPLAERVQHGLAGSARTATMFVDRDDFLDAVRDLCDRILGGYLDTLDAPVRLIAERTPDHVRFLDLVGDVYPDAAVVHIVRDGRDVARSLVSQPWGPTTYRDAALEWVSGIEAARKAAPRLDRYLEVSYERLLADLVHQVPALYRFLGLDDSEDVVRRALAEASVPYNVDPTARTLTESKWRGGLAPDELRAVLEVAGPLLDELGYDLGDEPGAVQRVTAGRPRREPPRSRAVRRDDPCHGALWRWSRHDRTGAGHDLSARVRSRLAGPVRRVAGREREDDAAFQRAVLARFDVTMRVVDALLADLAARRFDDLGRHFAPEARIRVLDGAASWDERGAGAVARLADAWADDPALTGRQLRGDVHPGVPSFTIVATWEAGGTTHDRVLVVTRYGDHIGELTWYRLPRLGAPRQGDDGPGAR